MFIRIESSSGVPISRQIADQIRRQSVSGALLPGDRLPSVRQLAKELAVNPNTILHVYERLTNEGLLERRHGDGTYLSQNLPTGRAESERRALLADLDRVAQRTAELQMPPAQAAELFQKALARAYKARPRPSKGVAND